MAGFFGGGVWTESTLRGGLVRMELPPKPSKLFGYKDARGGVMLSTKHPRFFEYLDVRGWGEALIQTLRNSDCLGTDCVDQAGLELPEIHLPLLRAS